MIICQKCPVWDFSVFISCDISEEENSLFKSRFCQFEFQLSDNHKKIPKTSEPVESTGYRPFSFTTIVIGNALTAGFSFFSFPSFRFHLLLFFPPLSQFLFILLLFLLLYISPHLVTLGKSSPQMDPTCQVHLV